MRIGGSYVQVSASYESPRVDSQKARVRMWIGEALSNHNPQQKTPRTPRTLENETEKKFDPRMLDWFIFLKTKNPNSDPMAGAEGVEEIRRLYQEAGPSYVAPPPPAAKRPVAKPSSKPEPSTLFDVVA